MNEIIPVLTIKLEDNATLIIPSKENILEQKNYSCWIENCSSNFTNLSHLEMHIQKHHKLTLLKDNSIKKYYCPELLCMYNINNLNSKFFTSFKSLKQHYIKVHSERNFICSSCEKTFPTEYFQKTHEKVCGQVYKCVVCSYDYASREALLTHARRKSHNYEQLLAEKKVEKKASQKSLNCSSISTQTEASKESKKRKNQTTQTEVPKKKYAKIAPTEIKNDSATQTLPDTTFDDSSSQTNLNCINYFDDSLTCFNASQFEDTDPVQCNIETQTDVIETMLSNISDNRGDPMLYTHMYTQTCDDILTELGLTNIETQTNWSTGYNDQNDYLVSTETQTNLNRCLLNGTNSSIQTQTSHSMEFLNDISSESNSIHTQTS